jgi:histidinol-phosphate aminotransferase
VNAQKPPQIFAARDELNWKIPSSVRKALLKAAGTDISHYRRTDPLAERIASDFGVSRKQVFLAQGAEGAINSIFSAAKNSVLFPEFAYSLYFDIAKARGLGIETFKVIERSESFYYDVPGIIRQLKESQPSILLLIDPESPLGFSVKSRDLDAVLESARGCLIAILDQAHEGIRKENVKNVRELLEAHPNLVVVRSFSKLYGLAAWRIGFAICGEAAGQAISLPSNRLGYPIIPQEIAIAALDAKEGYQKIAQQAREQKERFNSEVGMLGGYKMYQTDHLSCLVRVPEIYAKELMRLADSRNIAIRDLSTYHAGLAHLYRVTVGPRSITDRLIELFRDAAVQAGK